MRQFAGYDVIGDLHGHASALEGLLVKLGYEARGGAWRHPDRQAIFVGDFIDRGPRQLDTVRTVRAMVDAGSALAIMGNHELNATAFFLGLREDNPKNRHQHSAFLAAVEGKPVHRELTDWFLTLPLWLDLPDFQVVHACWHPSSMEFLSSRLTDRRLTADQMPEASLEPEDKSEKDTPERTLFKSVEALTKGIEVPLPAGVSFLDTDGHVRERARLRWWDPAAPTYRTAVLSVAEDERHRLPTDPVPAHTRAGLERSKPVFFGHYWMAGEPTLVNPLGACVDYSIAKQGRLCAYRYDGERELHVSKFVTVGLAGT